MTPLPPASVGAVLTIDLDALRSNYLTLKAIGGQAECAAVVKADAYGIGIERAVPALWSVGCRTFFVALLDEAERVLAVAPKATVYVLNGLFIDNAHQFLESDARPVISSLDEIREWAALRQASGEPLSSALHVDTGMNRIGLSQAQFDMWCESRPDDQRFDISLLMSHLACAEETANPMSEIQLENFLNIRSKLSNVPASLANSAGILLNSKFHFDVLRPGIALYGGDSLIPTAAALKPVVHLAGKILQVREVPSGDSVGYGATWVAERDSRIAIVSAGYADGYFRTSTAKNIGDTAYCCIDGSKAPVVGRVSMDMITIDVTDIETLRVARGEFVELLGHNITIDKFAHFSGTIGYEVLTNLGSRYARVYSGA